MSRGGRQIFALGNCSLHCSNMYVHVQACKICISHIHVGRIARWQGQFFALGNCSLHCSNMYIPITVLTDFVASYNFKCPREITSA
jgi:hypothetical protein